MNISLLFIHSSVGGHLDCFYFLATVKSVYSFCLNTCFQFFWCIYLGMELLDNNV